MPLIHFSSFMEKDPKEDKVSQIPMPAFKDEACYGKKKKILQNWTKM